MSENKPVGRVGFLVDTRNWAYDFVARSIAYRLEPKWDCRVYYADENPYLDPESLDLLYVFFWGENRYEQFGFSKEMIIKEVASYRWMMEERFGKLSPAEFVSRHLDGAGVVTTPCSAIGRMLSPQRENVYHCPNGFESALFSDCRKKASKLTFAWVGNGNDPGKGLHDIVLPAVGKAFDLNVLDGRFSRMEVRNKLQRAHVILVASDYESQPLPLVEAMACGCFPVTTNVGIVPEVVQDGFNGRIVRDRTVEAFRKVIAWCEENQDYVRAAGHWNAAYMREFRSWEGVIGRFDEILSYALSRRQAGAELTKPMSQCQHKTPGRELRLLKEERNRRGKSGVGRSQLFMGDLWNSLAPVRLGSRAAWKIRRRAELWLSRAVAGR